MSTSMEKQPRSEFEIETEPGQSSLGDAVGEYWNRIKGGDLGSLPAVLGCVVLVIVFGVLEPDSFLTEQNFANLINQGAAIMVLAMGLVFVLLLGEIDLSAGFTAGMGAAILGVTSPPTAGRGRSRYRLHSPRAWRSASRSRCSSLVWASRASSSRWPSSWACRARCC
jgi:hypothetical protein